MKRYTISWRMALDAAADPGVFEELLDRLTAGTSVADELWIILSEPSSYCYEPLESIAEKCERFRIPAAAARARGVRVGINPWPTFGTDEPYYADNGRPPMPFQSMVGCDGVKSIGTACPVSPEFLAYTKARYRLFAQTGASFVWVDDDCRLTHLGGTNYPCFCPNCVRHFDGGRFADRETLVAALDACVSYEEGTAGCSLKATQAAADLVACAKDLKETDLQAVAVAAKEWYDALPADRQQVFQENWPAIETDARTLARDPASMLEALDEAGVDTDFSVMDLTQAEGLVDTLRSALVQA